MGVKEEVTAWLTASPVVKDRGAGKDALAACLSVLTARGVEPTLTAVFGVALLALEAHAEDADRASPLCALVAVLLPHLPGGFVIGVADRVGMALSAATASSDTPPEVLAPATASLGALLRVQPGSRDDINDMIAAILRMVDHSEHEVRVAAAHALVSVLSYQSGSLKVRRTAMKFAVEYARRRLEARNVTAESASASLSILKEVAKFLSPSNTTKMVELTVPLAQAGSLDLTLSAMSMWNAIVQAMSVPPPADAAPADAREKLSPRKLEHLLAITVDLQPNAADERATKLFIKTVSGTVRALARIAPDRAEAVMSGALRSFFDYLLNPVPVVVKCAAENLVRIIPFVSVTEETLSADESAAITLVECCVAACGYKYKDVWPQAFSAIRAAIKLFPRDLAPAMSEVVTRLGGLRAVPDFAHDDLLVRTVGEAVRVLGPDVVLASLPVDLMAEESEETNAWLMPVLKRNVRSAHVGYFLDVLMPYGEEIHEAAVVAAERDGLPIRAKNLAIAAFQIWELLPSFCVTPLDFVERSDEVINIVGGRFTREPELQEVMCAALKKLVTKSSEVVTNGPEAAGPQLIGDDGAVDRAVATLETVGAAAEALVPMLLTGFLEASGNKRAIVLSTIDVVINITPPHLLSRFFKRAVTKLLKATVALGELVNADAGDNVDAATRQETADELAALMDKRHALTDLIAVLAVGLDEEASDLFARAITPALSVPDGTLQKKSYKALSNFIDGHEAYVNASLDGLANTLLEAQGDVLPGAKSTRLACLCKLFGVLAPDQVPLLLGESNVLLEIVVSLKEAGKAARSEASALVALLVTKTTGANGDFPLGLLLERVAAGFALDTPLAISATIGALEEVIATADVASDVDPAALHTLIDNVFLYFRHPEREVVSALLDFSKRVIGSLAKEVLGPHLPNMLDGLLVWAAGNTKRWENQTVVERLFGRGFTYDDLKDAFPDQHVRLLDYVYAEMEKEKRRQARKAAKEVERQRAEEADSSNAGPSMAWIIEAANADTPVDFLDPRVVSRITTANPELAAARAKEAAINPFTTGEDGRMVIRDLDAGSDDEGDEGASGGFVPTEANDESAPKSKRKRRRETEEDYDPDERNWQQGDGGAPASSALAALINRKKRQKRAQAQRGKHTGREYQPKKGTGGDLANKAVEPYSYTPFTRQLIDNKSAHLNRRKWKDMLQTGKTAKGAKAKRGRRKSKKR